MEKTKVTVCLPLYGQVPAYSVSSLLNLMIDIQEYYDAHFITILDLYVPLARCNMLAQIRSYHETGNKSDVIFFIDQDHYYHSNDAMNLIEGFLDSGYDVMGAMYRYKDETRRPVAFDIKEDSIECREDLEKDTGIQDLDIIGLGFCVMTPEFLERMHKEYGHWVFNCEIEGDKFNGEDVSFFKKAKKIGAKVGMDTNIYVKHVGAAV